MDSRGEMMVVGCYKPPISRSLYSVPICKIMCLEYNNQPKY